MEEWAAMAWEAVCTEDTVGMEATAWEWAWVWAWAWAVCMAWGWAWAWGWTKTVLFSIQ